MDSCGGFSDWDNYHSFQITATNRYFITPITSIVSEWKYTDAINRADVNTLRVDKKGMMCYFYINKTLVDSADASPLTGNTFGLFISDKQAVKFDDVLITERFFIPKTADSVTVLSEKFNKKENDGNIRPYYTRAAMNLGMLDDGTEVYLNNNRYFYRHNNVNGNGKFAEVYLGNDNDFTIESNIKYEKGDKGQTSGILWGFLDWDNNNVFMTSTDGAFRCATTINKKEISNGWIKTNTLLADVKTN